MGGAAGSGCGLGWGASRRAAGSGSLKGVGFGGEFVGLVDADLDRLLPCGDAVELEEDLVGKLLQVEAVLRGRCCCQAESRRFCGNAIMQMAVCGYIECVGGGR